MLLNNPSFLLLYFFLGCSLLPISCGDIFVKREQIYNSYYIVQGDTGDDISVCYNLGQNSYIRRVPPRVLEYSVLFDSFLIVKNKQKNDTLFYVLNMLKDNPFAEEKSYLIGSFKKVDFYNWLGKSEKELGFIKIE